MVAYWHARVIDGGEEGTGMGDVHKSSSNRLIFPFPLSHHIEKFSFSISTYMEEMLQQIDFSLFLYGKRDAMSPLSIRDWREIIGD